MMNDAKMANMPRGRGVSWILTVVLALVAFGLGLFWRGGRDGDHRHATTEISATVEESTNRQQVYYCSMHPQVRSVDPNDKCPICFMDLIPLPEDDNGEEAGEIPRLRLSENAAALMEIRTWPVERLAVGVEVGLFGKVDFDESRLYGVPVRTDGYVERLAANTPWQAIGRGDTLAEFYSPAAVTAMRELLVARQMATESNDGVLEAARARLQRMGVSRSQISEIERSGEVPRTFRVESPVDGRVLSVEAREGDFLREGADLTRVGDISQVWVNLEAYEQDLARLSEGKKVFFSSASLPGRSFEGVVTFLEPVIDPASRTARLRVEAGNPEGLLRPGMYVSARLSSEPDEDASALVVPATALLMTGKRSLVYVRIPGEDRPTFEPRQVALGVRAGDFYVVEEGLLEGELVVVNGQFKIDSELQIRGRASMLAPEGGVPPVHHHPEPASPGDSHAGHSHGEELPLQTDCPVMGGAINMHYYADVNGYRIFVCCPGCDDTILENPRHYLDRMRAEGVRPYRLQTDCPVMGLPINRDFHHDHDGQRIYVCCPACLGEIRDNAEQIIAAHLAKGIVFEKVEP